MPAKNPIWITGAHGLIGNYLVQTAAAHVGEAPVVGWNRGLLDLTDFALVKKTFLEQKPRLIIHCAALSKSPVCQADPALAQKVNVEVTKCLAGLAENLPFFFFSTDLVFDGRAGNYDEAAPVNPLSIYGETKAAAELIVRANPRHTIIRTSLNAGVSPAGDRSFNEEMRRAWQNGKTTKLFTDEFRSPIIAEVTARATWELAAAHRPGIYHLGGSERLSRWQMGRLIAARWPALKPRLEPGSLAEYQGAPRPADVSLNSAKIQSLLSFPLPAFSDWLAKHPEVPI